MNETEETIKVLDRIGERDRIHGTDVWSVPCIPPHPQKSQFLTMWLRDDGKFDYCMYDQVLNGFEMLEQMAYHSEWVAKLLAEPING